MDGIVMEPRWCEEKVKKKWQKKKFICNTPIFSVAMVTQYSDTVRREDEREGNRAGIQVTQEELLVFCCLFFKLR